MHSPIELSGNETVVTDSNMSLAMIPKNRVLSNTEGPDGLKDNGAGEKYVIDEAYSRWIKGKSKILEGHVFKNNGLQSSDFMSMIDGKKLAKLDDHFGNEVIDLDKEIFKEFAVFDIMDNELHDTLEEFMCGFNGKREKSRGQVASICINDGEKETRAINFDGSVLSDEGKDVEEVLLKWSEMEEKFWESQTSKT
ncbi:hypothetical protein AgCh_022170 [Apium graveolens]